LLLLLCCVWHAGAIWAFVGVAVALPVLTLVFVEPSFPKIIHPSPKPRYTLKDLKVC
jgi:hypothetical protein